MFGAFHPKKGTSFFFFFFIVAKKRLRRSVRLFAGLSSERATDARKGVSKNLGGGEYRTSFCRDEPKNKIKPMNKKIEPGPGEGGAFFHFEALLTTFGETVTDSDLLFCKPPTRNENNAMNTTAEVHSKIYDCSMITTVSTIPDSTAL